MEYKVNWDGGGVFAVPDSAADCLKLASGKAVKVLLFFMKYRTLPENPEDIGVTDEDIEDALSYWENVGVIYRSNCVPAPSQAPVKPASPSSPPPVVIKPHKALLPSEIAERIESSEEISFLFNQAESTMKKVLTHDDQRTILWIYDHLGMSPEVIIMLIAFCCSIDRGNMGYIEKIAVDWHSKEITTYEKAESEILCLQKKHTFQGQVQSRLKLQSKLTASQKKYIGEWAVWDMSVDMVELAYDKTVDSTGKAIFHYMNKILQKWHENGITSVEAAAEFDERTKPSFKGNASPQKNQKPVEKKSDGSPSFDLSLIMEHAKNNTPKI